MSRIGIKPITVPASVTVQIEDGNLVTVRGPKGELQSRLHEEMLLEQADGQLTVRRPSEQRRHRALHGLTRSLLNNMVRSEEHTSELQSRQYLVCRLLLEKKKHL